MSSQAQVLANRRNAQQSTGPKTVEGKEVVSQNAVKHGLSARRDVLRGEDQGEFERHRQELLDDLAAVGAMESMLAQRIVSLSWRLVRAQRMQDAAIEALCADYVRGPLTEDTLKRVAKTVERTKEDRPGPEDELTLGLAVARDFSQERAIERLLTYEGKIEASLYKAMNELEKLRRMQRADGAARQNKANPQPRDGVVASLLAMTNEGPVPARDTAVEDSTAQNKANSACSVPVRACPERAEWAYPESAEEVCTESVEGLNGLTPDGVTTNGQNKANRPDKAAVQNKANPDAEDRPATATPGVLEEAAAQNKANFPAEPADGPSQDPTSGPVPLGT